MFQCQEIVPAEAIPLEAVIKQAKDIVTDTLKFALNIVSILDKHPKDAQSDRDKDEKEEVEDEEQDSFSSSDSAEGEDESSGAEHREEFLREEIARGYLEVRSFEIEGRPGEVTVEQFKDVVNDMKKPRDKKVLFATVENKSEDVVPSVNAKSVGRFGKGQRLDFEEESRKQEKKEQEEKNKAEPRTKQDSGAKISSKGAETTTCSEDR